MNSKIISFSPFDYVDNPKYSTDDVLASIGNNGLLLASANDLVFKFPSREYSFTPQEGYNGLHITKGRQFGVTDDHYVSGGINIHSHDLPNPRASKQDFSTAYKYNQRSGIISTKGLTVYAGRVFHHGHLDARRRLLYGLFSLATAKPLIEIGIAPKPEELFREDIASGVTSLVITAALLLAYLISSDNLANKYPKEIVIPWSRLFDKYDESTSMFDIVEDIHKAVFVDKNISDLFDKNSYKLF